MRDEWHRIRAGFALPGLDAKEVTQSEAWYAARPELVTKIFERSRYYLFHIVEEIERRGMPMELALLPFVESGFDPFALSPAQASGLWQFIPGTANKYKLPQNDGFDARRDIIASTTAALDYLSNASATMPLVVPVDRAQGFEQRLDEFMQKEQARQKRWTVKSSRRPSQRVWHKGNSD